MTSNRPQVDRLNDWWMLFPLKGIALTSPAPQLESAVWHDATLVSPSHIPSLVKQMRVNERSQSTHDHEQDIVAIINGLGRDRRQLPSTFIAIRRRVQLSPEDRPTIPSSAVERASCLQAGLAIGFLKHGRFGWLTCVPLRYGQLAYDSTSAIDLNAGGFLASFAGRGIMFGIADPAIPVSYEAVQTMLLKSTWPHLVALLCRQPTTSDTSLVKRLRLAACRYTLACLSSTPESQVLGAVTALEMLLSTNGDFRQLEARVLVLADGLVQAEQVIKAVLKARHEYVHQGQTVDPETPSLAVEVLLATLERAAIMTQCFQRLDQLTSYLDAREAITRSQVVCPGLSPDVLDRQHPLWANADFVGKLD